MIERLLEAIHHEIDDKCKIALTCDWNYFNKSVQSKDDPLKSKIMNDNESSFYDRLSNYDSFIKKANFAATENMEDVYFSINSFRKGKKNTEDVWHLNAFALDFDFYKIKEYKNLSPEEMYNRVLKDSMPITPTSVIDSGRGLYIIYVFKHAPRAMIDTYKAIYKTFYEMFKQYGMDSRAMNVTQIIRLPGTFNTNALREVKILEMNDTSYKLEDFFKLFPYKHEEVVLYKDKKREKSNENKSNSMYIVDFKKRKAHRLRKFNEIYKDIEKLISLRSYKMNGYRETTIFLIRKMIQWHDGSIEEELKYASAINNLFDDPLNENELTINAKPAGKTRCPGVAWIIQKLEITDEEQKSLNKLQRKSLKDSLYHKKRRKHNLLGLTPSQRKQLERRTRVAKLKNEGKSNSKIAQILNINKSTVTRDLRYIKENAWRFKKKLSEAMTELKVILNDITKARKIVFSEQEELREWLKISHKLLN